MYECVPAGGISFDEIVILPSRSRQSSAALAAEACTELWPIAVPVACSAMMLLLPS